MKDMIDIFERITEFDEYIAESEAIRCFFTLCYHNNKVILNYIEEYITNESYHNIHEPIETKRNTEKILTFSASAEEYINILIDFISNKREYVYNYGERRVNTLHFIPIPKVTQKIM